VKLNLGAGGQKAEGWTSVDRAGDVDVTLDLVADDWPWPAGSVDGIVLHHILCMLTVEEMATVLANCYRVMKPGGVLRVSDADLARGIQAALRFDFGWFVEYRGGDSMEKTVGFFITQGGARKQHLQGWDLVAQCENLGFRTAGWSSDEVVPNSIPSWVTELDSRQGESWFAWATK